MIQATIIRNSGGNYKGFRIDGHAGYGAYGQDIVCAAASVLAQNTINSIERFTNDDISGEMDESKGILKMKFSGVVSRESMLLMDSMVLGLTAIEDAYGSRYIKIRFEEV